MGEDAELNSAGVAASDGRFARDENDMIQLDSMSNLIPCSQLAHICVNYMSKLVCEVSDTVRLYIVCLANGYFWMIVNICIVFSVLWMLFCAYELYSF